LTDSASNILVLNSGSSSIKFAAFDSTVTSNEPDRTLSGALSGIGSNAELTISAADGAPTTNRVDAPDHLAAISRLFDALQSRHGLQNFAAVGHRIVHGGPHHFAPQRVDPQLLSDLRDAAAFAPEHLPQAIKLIEAIATELPTVPQIACFDTAFHQNLPTVARTLPLPRRFQSIGVRRYGFHGLSYEYLMRRLAQLGHANGRVILAHLGNGASMAAVRDGKPMDTTMGLTPAGGLVMGSRTGDIDPGIARFLERHDQLTPEQFDHLVNHESGLRGISETTSDMRQLAAAQATDSRAAEAIELFCYSARKWIGALAAGLDGLDMLVFSGGIGEHSAEARSRICDGLQFLGIQISPSLNTQNAAIISRADASVVVRVIPTDEESTIFRAVVSLLSKKPELST
jgi:acetate kinase